MFRTVTAALALAALAAAPVAALAAPSAIASGAFTSGAHDTMGTVTIYKLDDGSRILRLSDFTTSNGPAVHVLLSSATTISGNGDVTAGKTLDLGDLKGNTGNQNYAIPAGTDLSRFHSVSIWCSRFKVNFGAASLADVK